MKTYDPSSFHKPKEDELAKELTPFTVRRDPGRGHRTRRFSLTSTGITTRRGFTWT